MECTNRESQKRMHNYAEHQYTSHYSAIMADRLTQDELIAARRQPHAYDSKLHSVCQAQGTALQHEPISYERRLHPPGVNSSRQQAATLVGTQMADKHEATTVHAIRISSDSLIPYQTTRSNLQQRIAIFIRSQTHWVAG